MSIRFSFITPFQFLDMLSRIWIKFMEKPKSSYFREISTISRLYQIYYFQFHEKKSVFIYTGILMTLYFEYKFICVV